MSELLLIRRIHKITNRDRKLKIFFFDIAIKIQTLNKVVVKV